MEAALLAVAEHGRRRFDEFRNARRWLQEFRTALARAEGVDGRGC